MWVSKKREKGMNNYALGPQRRVYRLNLPRVKENLVSCACCATLGQQGTAHTDGLMGPGWTTAGLP